MSSTIDGQYTLDIPEIEDDITLKDDLESNSSGPALYVDEPPEYIPLPTGESPPIDPSITIDTIYY